MNTIDIIDRLPAYLAARLECDPFFADIPIVVADAGNTAEELARKQAVIAEKNGKAGVAVIVLQLVGRENKEFEQVHGPMIFNPAFLVIENRELNLGDAGTGKSHRKVARRIVQRIKSFAVDDLIQAMKCATPCIEPADLSELGNKNVVGSQVNFECWERLTETLVFAAPPRFGSLTEAGPQFTLASETPGAAIWFTTDDTFPFNGGADVYPGSTSQLYSAAQDIPVEGVIVQAAAYLDGAIESGIVRRTIKYTQ